MVTFPGPLAHCRKPFHLASRTLDIEGSLPGNLPTQQLRRFEEKCVRSEKNSMIVLD